MATVERIAQALDDTCIMDERNDISLMDAIAIDRDDAAFGELCQRYQKRAFCMSFRILCNSAMAEEVVQEAMLSIWLSARSFQQKRGSVASWILSIVMKKSLKLKQSQKRSAYREEYVSMERHRSGPVTSENMEGSELIAVLQHHIGQLPDTERTLLISSYCTNMSQQEIAKMLGVSHQTVSKKLRQVLEHLRMGLTQAGVAAIVPLLSAESLFEAVTTGQDCPQGMNDRIMARVRGHKGPTSSMSRRVLIGRGSWALPVGLAVVLAAGLGIAWWSAQNQEHAVQSVKADQRPATATAQPIVANDNKPIHERWTFEKGPVEALKVIQGNWKWQRIPPNGGQMVVPEALVTLPIELPAHPVVIKIKNNISVAQPVTSGVCWMNGSFFVPNREWTKFLHLQNQVPPVRVDISIYSFDRYVITQWNGHTCQVREARTPYPSRSVTLALAGLNVEEIEAHSLSANEIPAFLHNVPQIVKEMGVEPTERDELGREITTSAEKK